MNNATATSSHTGSSIKALARRRLRDKTREAVKFWLPRVLIAALLVAGAVLFFTWEPFKTSSLSNAPQGDVGFHKALYDAAGKPFIF